MAFEEAFLRASLVMESSRPLSSRIPMTLRVRCCCWFWKVQVVLVKRRGREMGRRREGGLNGKMKSLVEGEKKIVFEAKLVAMVMILKRSEYQ